MHIPATPPQGPGGSPARTTPTARWSQSPAPGRTATRERAPCADKSERTRTMPKRAAHAVKEVPQRACHALGAGSKAGNRRMFPSRLASAAPPPPIGTHTHGQRRTPMGIDAHLQAQTHHLQVGHRHVEVLSQTGVPHHTDVGDEEGSQVALVRRQVPHAVHLRAREHTPGHTHAHATPACTRCGPRCPRTPWPTHTCTPQPKPPRNRVGCAAHGSRGW